MALNSAHKGYIYQDLLTCYFILKEILNGNKKSIFYIDKKHIENDRFDDLVIIHENNIYRKQIKYSDETTARELIKSDLANDSKDLAIYELYNSWKQLKTKNSEFRLCLAWDSPSNTNIKNILIENTKSSKSISLYDTNIFKIDIDKLWAKDNQIKSDWIALKKFVETNNIQREEFKEFCNSLIIELTFPKEGNLKEIVLNQVIQLGIGEFPNQDQIPSHFIERFAKKINDYRSRLEEITISQVLKDLDVKITYGSKEQKFEISQTKNIKSEERYEKFDKYITKNKKSIIIGEPGSGKSWFLTNFIEYLKSNNISVLRHYCFTSTNYDNLEEERITSDVFFGNLINDIIKNFPHLEANKDHLYSANLKELNILLSTIKEKLVIIIDGLDHIERVYKNTTNLKRNEIEIINFISKIKPSNNTSIVLSSQPVEEIQRLTEKDNYKKYKIEKWKENDIEILMDKFLLSNINIKNKNLSTYLLEKSDGNPLYLTYLIKMLKNQNTITLKYIKELPQYDFNLKKYYDYLTAKLESTPLTSEVLACLDFTVTKNELKEILNVLSDYVDQHLSILSPIINTNLNGGMKLYHDSFRRYSLEKIVDKNILFKKYQLIIDWLENKGFYKDQKSYRYLLLYYLKSEKFNSIKKYASNDFLNDSLYYGYSKESVKLNYDIFLATAKQTNDFPLFTYLGELNRTMFNISPSQYDPIKENFRDYFYSLGLAFGFKKATNLLFLENKGNFSEELISQAFYISRVNGTIPNWKKLANYFKKINTKNFDSFIYYLIDTNKLDNFISKNKNKLLEDKNYKDFCIFIEEIYHEFGIEKIIEFVDLLEEPNKNLIIKDINDILSSIDATNFLVLNKKIEIELDELNLEVLQSNYAHKDQLEKFYYNLKQHAHQDIKKLKKYKKTINPTNFITAWVSFCMELFILEDKLIKGYFKTYSDFEEKLLDKFFILSFYPDNLNSIYESKDIIHQPFYEMLNYIKTKWHKTIDIFMKLHSMHYEKRHIFSLDVLANYKNKKNIHFIIKEYENFLEKNSKESHGHFFQIKQSFELTSLYGFNKDKKRIKTQLKKTIKYITSYGHRKDMTLEEIQYPLDSLNKIDNLFALKYAKKLLPINLSIQNHSEINPKGIKWLYIDWFDELAQINHDLAIKYLIKELLLDKDNFWKLDDMYMWLLHRSKHIDPIILDILYKISPSNTQDRFIKDFADNTDKLKSIDKKLAHNSMINILSRNLNTHSEPLENETILKLESLKNHFNINIEIPEYNENDEFKNTIKNNNSKNELIEKNDNELIEYITTYGMRDNEIDFLIDYLIKIIDKKRVYGFLLQLVRIKTPSRDYHKRLYPIIDRIKLPKKNKIALFVELFIFSRNENFYPFSHADSFVHAVSLDKKKALEHLSKTLGYKLKEIDYHPGSTSKLIKVFEVAKIDKKIIKQMYKRGFEFISNRVLFQKECQWKNLKDIVPKMNKDELFIVLFFSKMKNANKIEKREIINLIDYLIKYDEKLLIEPLKWFFKNFEIFPFLIKSVVAKAILLNKDKELFNKIKPCVEELKYLDYRCINEIIEEV